MKNQRFMSVLIGFALLSACSSDETTNPANPGTGGTPPAPSGGSGGKASVTGGTSPTGGNPATGGTSVTGGSTATGGTSATGGSTATGGTPGASGSGTGGASAPTGGVSGISGGGGAPGSGGSAGGSTGGGGSGATKWLGTWTASPYPAPSDAQPPASLSNSVLRQVARVSVGGSQIRVQFSNLSGNGPVNIKSAHVALCKATPAVDGSIDAATDTAVAFSGMESVTIAQGQEVWSDPITFTVPPLGTVSITTALGSVPSTLTSHAGSRTTSYIQTASTDVSVANLTSAQKTDHWYFISGIDVMADASARGIVAIGDSITDGRGTDTNRNNRWTDILAARLQANPATANVSVMNQGIGATNLIGTGTAAEARFNRDVLAQSGVKYAIIYDGVNDIGGGASFEAMKAAYDKMIAAGKAKGVFVYGATFPPFGGNSYYSVAHENVRVQANTYIKSGAFDGYIDFDAALTDGGNPPKLQTTFATWAQTDGLHPGPAGYQKMGETPDLMLFTK